MAPARNATAWAASTISIPRKSSSTGRSLCSTAAWARAPARRICITCCNSRQPRTVSISSTPFEKFPEKIQNLLLYGEAGKGGKTGFSGILGYLKQSLEESSSDSYREWLLDYMSATECPACHGKRLRPESLAVKVNGMSIADFTGLPVAAIARSREEDQLTGREELIAGRIVHEIVERLQFLHAVGLGYISLDRSAATLSGGEGQRIRLATQIGSKLRGVLYVLDEPSIGLASPRQRPPAGCARRICAISATPCWWSSTTKTPSAAPTT